MSRPEQPRRRTGQYAFTDMKLMCKCGHTLGEHEQFHPWAAIPEGSSGSQFCLGFKRAKEAK